MSNRGRFRREPYQLKNGMSETVNMVLELSHRRIVRCGRGQALDALSGLNVN